MIKFFKGFLSFFTTITTAILIIVAVDIGISDYGTMPDNLPLRIIAAGFITSAVTAAAFSIDIKTRKQYFIMTAVHYVLLCGIMSGLGIWFGWISAEVLGVLIMCGYVAAVYIIVFVITYLLQKKEADELNRALKERNGK